LQGERERRRWLGGGKEALPSATRNRKRRIARILCSFEADQLLQICGSQKRSA
jgi:hypothetical protein